MASILCVQNNSIAQPKEVVGFSNLSILRQGQRSLSNHSLHLHLHVAVANIDLNFRK
jgi:hypothetical protein